MSTGCRASSTYQPFRHPLKPQGAIQGAVTWQIEDPADMEAIFFLPSGQKIKAPSGTALVIKCNKAFYKAQFLEDGEFAGPLLYVISNPEPPKRLAQISSDLSGTFFSSVLFFLMLSTIGIGLFKMSDSSNIHIAILGLIVISLSALTAYLSRHIWSAQILAGKHALQYAKGSLSKEPVLVSLPTSARHLAL